MNSSNYSERRSSPRFVMSEEQPVYFRAVCGDQEFQMLVENLSLGGALLMCPAIYGAVQNGQCLPDGELVVSGKNSPRVNVVVRWQMWPRLGVEFDNLSADAACEISELLETVKSSVLA